MMKAGPVVGEPLLVYYERMIAGGLLRINWKSVDHRSIDSFSVYTKLAHQVDSLE